MGNAYRGIGNPFRRLGQKEDPWATDGLQGSHSLPPGTTWTNWTKAMPELPDVEVLRRYVDSTSLHRRIDDLLVRSQLVEGSPQTIRRHLRGSTLEKTRRHGKHLFVRSSREEWLRLHFGMTGSLRSYSDGDASPYTELRLDFEDGSHLAYLSRRKLGAIAWVGAVDTFIEQHRLGPDPLADEVGKEEFAELVGSRKGSIKSTLMNQEVLAGLGNVYVDEVLFQAGIHPASETVALGEERLRHLHRTMRRVINGAIDHGADVDRVPRRWLLPHREPDAPLPAL